MFLATTRHALALIGRLEDPDFWGVNPEILQHEGMTNLSAINAIAMAINAGKLYFIHLGNQKPGQFDNDNPVMTGMDGVKEFIRHNVESYRLAEKKADQLAENSVLNKLVSEICDKQSPLARALESYDFDTRKKTKIDYNKLNTTPLKIAQLDYEINKALLGL